VSDNPNGWVARLEDFLDRLPRTQAETTADELDAFSSDLIEITERISAIGDNLRDWADNDVDRDDRNDARDAAVDDIGTLISELTTLSNEIGVSRAS
jgi:hypothetical protein